MLNKKQQKQVLDSSELSPIWQLFFTTRLYPQGIKERTQHQRITLSTASLVVGLYLHRNAEINGDRLELLVERFQSTL